MVASPVITDIPAFLALYIAFAVKQFLGDFLLQPSSIAAGKGAAEGWLRALSIHAGVHGGLTMIIALVVFPAYWWIGVIDFAIHFTIDRGKAVLTRRLALGPGDDAFWWAFGGDQFAHQITHIGWVILLASV